MRKLFDHKFFKEYSGAEWFIAKCCIVLLWLDIISHVSINPDAVLYPSGLCSLFNCSFLLSAYLKNSLLASALILSVLYIAERKMALTTLFMFVFSLIAFTLEESNGILNRCGLYTLTFLAQSIAYFRNNDSLKAERIQFPVQIIAAGYFLSSISKLHQSGLYWVTDAPYASIQMVKSYCYNYFDSGNVEALHKGMAQSNFALQHQLLVKILFGCSLLFESFAWLAVRNKASAFVIGLLLTAMHIGILYFMNILIVAIFYPMLIFMVNPVYVVYAGVKGIYKRV